jgi:hypothetical protein
MGRAIEGIGGEIMRVKGLKVMRGRKGAFAVCGWGNFLAGFDRRFAKKVLFLANSCRCLHRVALKEKQKRELEVPSFRLFM